jgi:TAT (twin-arginine translocation) pathway signal sequence
MSGLDVNRRDFMKIAAGGGAALAMPSIGHTAVSSKMIGIQVGAVSFVDEGTEKASTNPSRKAASGVQTTSSAWKESV